MAGRSGIVVALAALVLVLAGLNLWQWTRPAPAPVSMQLTPQQIVDLFHELFYRNPRTWPRNRWLDVPTQQNPNDAWITQEILVEVKPDVVVETGTANGGSAALWAMVLSHVNPDARVVTVDIEDNTELARRLPLVQQRVDFLVGSSTAPEIIEEVRRRVAGKKVLVILDSDHSQQHVARELELYAPLVSVGSYLIVQDTNVNGHPVYKAHGPGPMEALNDFLAVDDRFEVDRYRERLLFTMHPRGYLKRVK